MKYILITLLVPLLNSSFVYSQSQQELETMNEKSHQEAFDQLSKGMTPEQAQLLKAEMEKLKKQEQELMKLGPEEQNAKMDEAFKKAESQETSDKFKKEFENMSPEEKETFKKMMQNGNELK